MDESLMPQWKLEPSRCFVEGDGDDLIGNLGILEPRCINRITVILTR